MSKKFRLPILFAFIAIIFALPVMVRTVLSAEPTPPSDSKGEIPLVPTPIAPLLEMRTLSVIPDPGDGGDSIPPTLFEIDISQTAEDDHNPHVAYNFVNENYLVIWQDKLENGFTNIYGRYLDRLGNSINESFLIAETLEGVVRAEVIFGGGTYLVFWRQGEDIFFGSLEFKPVSGDSSGPLTIPDESTIIHEAVLEDFDIVFNEVDNTFLVIWLDYRHPLLGGTLRGEIYGKRISASGLTLGDERNLVPFEQNPSNTELGKILMAPSVSGDLSIAFNPNSLTYVISFSNYYCIPQNCNPREDVRIARLSSVTLSLITPHYGITENLPKIQWQSQVLYQPRMDEFLVIWSDNRNNEEDFDLVGKRLDGDGISIPVSGFITLTDNPGSQEFPRGAVIPGEGESPAYAIVWQDNSPDYFYTQSYIGYLDENGTPQGGSIIPSNLPGRSRTRPDIAVSGDTTPKTFMVWKDAQPYRDADIHGRVMSANLYLSVNLISPVNFTMVFSVKPTFLWGDVPGAAQYRLSIYDYSGEPPAEPDKHLLLEANDTRNEGDPNKHSYKLGGGHILSTGPTLSESGHLWRVTALDSDGREIGASIFGMFQIPPLGIEPDNPFWSDFDQEIYYWSELHDLPPNLYKAVLAAESGEMHDWFDLGPTRGYLYEGKHDEVTCHPSTYADVNYCYGQYFDEFLTPLSGENHPDLLPGGNSEVKRNLSLPSMMGLRPTAYLTNWRAMAKYTGCTGRPDPWDSNAFFDCLVNWYDERYKVAQYRVMAGYGLSGINYWTNIPVLYPNDPDHVLPYQADPTVQYTPEDLYTPNLNIRLGTQILGNKRCWWHNAAHSHPPYLDPINTDHEYLSAKDYGLEDYERWRQVIASYAGYGFYYPILFFPNLQIERVEWRFMGEDDEGNDYPGTFPVDLSGYDEIGIDVEVRFEESPQQWSQDKVYGDNFNQDTWDRNLKMCPYLEYNSQTQSSIDISTRAGGSVALSLAAQTTQGVIIKETDINLKDYLNPEWIQLVWEGDPDVHFYNQARVRIYDIDQQNLLWESPPLDGVTRYGFGQAIFWPGMSTQYFQVEFAVSAHSSKTYFVIWDEDEYRLLQFEDSFKGISDYLVSTGGGAFMEPDSSIVILNRGENPALQTDFHVFAPGKPYYVQERSYTFDTSIEDDTPPLTTLSLDPVSDLNEWIGLADLIISTSDDNGVAHMDYSLSDLSPGEDQRTYLSEVRLKLEEGRWTLRYHATDIYGNVEPEHQFALNVDQTPPATFLILDGTFDPDGGGFRSSVEVLAASEDPLLVDGSEGSGVAQVQYSLDQGLSWLTYPDPLIIEEVGSHEIWVRGVDHAGNQEEPILESFEILPHGITIQPPLGYPIGTAGKNLAVGRTFQDTDLTATHTGTFQWGDGSPETTVDSVPLSDGWGSVFAVHIYQDVGIYNATLIVTNNSGVSAREDFPVTIHNPPPEVEAGPDQEAQPGEVVQFNGSFTDPAANDNYTITWRFGDGASAEGTLTPTHSYAAEGIYEVILQVDDDEGDNGSDILVVTVIYHPPEVDAGPDQEAQPGEVVQFNGSFTDPGAAETHTISWEFGDGNSETGTLTPTHSYNEEGGYTVTLTVTDDDGGVGTGTLIVTVEASNLPPEISLGGHVQTDEGDLFTRTGSFTDPDSNNWTGEVDYGLGAGIQPLVLDGKNFTLEQLYLDNELYTVTVRITDEEGASDDASFVVTVTNVAPKLGEISAPGPVQLGNEVQVETTFTDPGQDSWMATWDWGDGNQNAGTIADFLVSGEHTYQKPGLYLIELTITDDDGGEDSAIYADQVIYDQEGGFITGGGWIQSPVGAYPSDPESTGKANFNLNLKYKKKAAAPSGNNKFDFKEGDLDFKATDYLWLVVDGNLAIMRGEGEVNKQAGYGFLISAIDGELDKIRIKIWEQGSGLVVYDNQPGDPDEVDPITELGGGSIVIHK